MENDYDIESDIIEERVYRVGSKRFTNKQDAIKYREERLLEEFLNGIWGNRPYYYSEAKQVAYLAKNSGDYIGKLSHYIKTVLTKAGTDIPETGLVNIDLAADPRIDQSLATELLMETVWRVMIGQKSITRNSFKKKVEENPDLFYKGLNDLVELYAWQKLEK